VFQKTQYFFNSQSINFDAKSLITCDSGAMM